MKALIILFPVRGSCCCLAGHGADIFGLGSVSSLDTWLLGFLLDPGSDSNEPLKNNNSMLCGDILGEE